MAGIAYEGSRAGGGRKRAVEELIRWMNNNHEKTKKSSIADQPTASTPVKEERKQCTVKEKQKKIQLSPCEERRKISTGEGDRSRGGWRARVASRRERREKSTTKIFKRKIKGGHILGKKKKTKINRQKKKVGGNANNRKGKRDIFLRGDRRRNNWIDTNHHANTRKPVNLRVVPPSSPVRKRSENLL